ncbi:AAA family ATPase [Bacteriovorax sp. Seq25_V]|uniref:AAA family ATPase n=1 Tax=Bacteriovorax sp. Seq25_V TaxID=1201288 RepID=UPI00038A2869|nr:AAA family ATPase [Bacteriovorax sp. Seq25_V]EQC46125.1 kinase domain protein [Bacteriovorax sp. Seq25_V]
MTTNIKINRTENNISFDSNENIELVAKKREFELIKNLEHPNIISSQKISLDVQQHYNTLEARVSIESLSFYELLKMATGLLNALDFLWAKNIVFNNLNPRSVVVDFERDIIKLSDFRLYSEISSELIVNTNLNRVFGNYHFISPEQTGRMNRSIDYRSDIYSLGALFYYSLTGKFLFAEEKDNHKIIHAHLTKKPQSLCDLDNRINPCLSKVIDKMLEKNSEDRYQSAKGILSDLEFCALVIEGKRSSDEFILGKYDKLVTFKIDETLHGRERETSLLMKAYGDVVFGRNRLALVSGFSGIGKTALVSELKRPMTEHNGYYISGKFDQLKKNIPFSGLNQAITQLVNEVLTESQDVVQSYVDKIKKTVGDNISLISDVIPAVKNLFPHTKKLKDELSATESLNLFCKTFSSFISVFKESGKPIVLFLDDLQWADSSTISLIKFLITDIKDHNILIIAGYRNNEVGPNHPWQICINESIALGGIVDNIELQNLEVSHLEKLIKNTLHLKDKSERLLAQVIFEKTNGNPFFAQSILKSLYEREIIFFDEVLNIWNFDSKKIGEIEISNNLIELLVQGLNRIEPRFLEVLQCASAVGAQFDIDIVSHTLDISKEVCLEALIVGLEKKYINALDINYRFVKVQDAEELKNSVFKFAHDKIQQALYETIEQKKCLEFHRHISNYYESITTDDNDDLVFDLTFHANKLLEHGGEVNRPYTSKINKVAGLKAYESSAFQAAREYFEISYNLLPDDRWESNYEEALDVGTHLSECYYLCNETHKAESLYNYILERARSNRDKAKVYEILMNYYTLQGRADDAVTVGAKALKLYGISFPAKTKMYHVAPKLLQVKIMFLFNSNEKILENPVATNEDAIAALKILSNMSPSCFIQSPESMLLNCLNCLVLTLRYGNSDVGSYAISLMGFVEAVALKNYKRAHELVKVAVKLNKKLNGHRYYSKVLFAWNNFVQFYHAPIRESIPWLRKGHYAGVDCGDFNFASYSLYCLTSRELYIGKPLSEVYENVLEYSQFCDKVGDQYMLPIMQVLRRFTTAISGLADVKYSKIDEGFDVDEFLKVQGLVDDKQTLSWFYIFEAIKLYLLNDIQKAFEYTLVAEKIGEIGTQKQIVLFEHYFFSVLICSALVRKGDMSNSRKLSAVTLCKSSLHHLSKMKDVMPENFRARFYLAKAEYMDAFTNESNIKIQNYYIQAIDAAEEDGFVNIVAIASELYSLFLIKNKRYVNARGYIQKSIEAYQTWEFPAKEEYLNNLSSQFMLNNHNSRIAHNVLLEISKSIAKHISLDSLISEVKKIAIEYTNAQDGLIVQKQGSEYHLLSDSHSGHREMRFCRAIIEYVYNTGEVVRLDDASEYNNFSKDSYFTNNRVFSICALPLRSNDDIKAVLFLVNKDLKGVFSIDKTKTMELLTTQIALSLENALFLQSLEQKVKERTELLELKTLELEKSHADKDILVRVLCHDLANITMVNNHSVRVLNNMLKDHENEDVKKHLTKMQNAIKNEAYIINNIRTLEMAKNKLLNVNLDIVNLEEKLNESIMTFEERLAQKDIVVRVNPDLVGRTVVADGVALVVNVFNNIFSNAIKYSYEHSHIDCYIATEDDETITLAIQDFGVGMTENFRNKLFTSEVHSSSSGTSNEKGSGFGLNIIKVYIHKFGGHARVDSVHQDEDSVKHGTTFYLTLLKK